MNIFGEFEEYNNAEVINELFNNDISKNSIKNKTNNNLNNNHKQIAEELELLEKQVEIIYLKLKQLRDKLN